LLEIKESLLKISQSAKFPHALLFAGPKGTGKTSAARILAKAANCLRLKKSGEPCDKCPNCQDIMAGNALDLLEIDAASNRGIDDIRNLKEKIRLSPVKFRYKVYIIDEAHMLTAEAFNALLKTLEEPPAHAIFILCTTAPEKLPSTIISRCLQFNFRKANQQEIIKGPLKRAVESEKLKVEKGVFEEIARSVDGSFRDAHKILEQLALGGKKITLKETKKLLGQIDQTGVVKLLGFLSQNETKAALAEINRLVVAGTDLNFYLENILDCLRQSLLAKVGLESFAEIEEIKKLSVGEIRSLIGLFTRAAGEMKWSPIPQLPLELVVVEWGEGRRTRSTPNVVEADKPANPSAGGRIQSNKDGPAELKSIMAKWKEVLVKIKPLNHSVEALLKATKPIGFDGQALTLEVFYKFHKERLETEKYRAMVEEMVSQVLGEPVKVKCVLGEKKKGEDFDIINVAQNIFNGKAVD
jgi:DNA polymerase-3 subunit gamma/tau